RLRDLPDLLLALARRHGNIYSAIERVEGELLSFLYTQRFPGNVRELENDVQRMLFSKTAGTSLALADWRSAEAGAEESPDLLGEAAANVCKAISLQGVSYTEAVHRIEGCVLEWALK